MGFDILKIKELLKEKGITQKHFAQMINISRPTLLNYFNGRSKIDVYTIEKIAEILDVNVCYFFQSRCFQTDKHKPGFEIEKSYKTKLENRLLLIENRLKEVEEKY